MVRHRSDENAAIKSFLNELAGAIRQMKLDGHVRMLLTECCEQPWNNPLASVQNGHDAQVPPHVFTLFAYALAGDFSEAQEFTRIGEEALTCHGEAHHMRVTPQQYHARGVLKLAQLPAHRGLLGIEGTCCRGDTSALRDAHERAQQAQIIEINHARSV